MLTDVALLGAQTPRTHADPSAMCAAGVMPADIILLHRKVDGGTQDMEKAAAGSRLKIIEEEDVNAPAVVQAVAALPEKYVIISGAGGAIVRRPLFETAKRFVHVHPGRLPEFRGSTTIYYGLLKENRVEASAIFLEDGIDTGPVIGHASFPPPADRIEIDRGYDPDIRAKLLVAVLLRYKASGRFEETPQPPSRDKTYYIIHPVLKHLAILAK